MRKVQCVSQKTYKGLKGMIKDMQKEKSPSPGGRGEGDVMLRNNKEAPPQKKVWTAGLRRYDAAPACKMNRPHRKAITP